MPVAAWRGHRITVPPLDKFHWNAMPCLRIGDAPPPERPAGLLFLHGDGRACPRGLNCPRPLRVRAATPFRPDRIRMTISGHPGATRERQDGLSAAGSEHVHRPERQAGSSGRRYHTGGGVNDILSQLGLQLPQQARVATRSGRVHRPLLIPQSQASYWAPLRARQAPSAAILLPESFRRTTRRSVHSRLFPGPRRSRSAAPRSSCKSGARSARARR